VPHDQHRNGSAGSGDRAARVAEANRILSDNQESRRHWRRVRAVLDTLCEIQGAAVGGQGVDRSTALRLFADAVDEIMPTLEAQGRLARAEAIDMDRGRDAPPPPADETSETRRARRRANGEDSQPGKKRP
jgi:hypothetical protein